MLSFKYAIKDKDGIHARPAGILVAEAKKFKSTITIFNRGRSCVATRLFGIMGLSVKYNEDIEVTFDGEDEKLAYEAFKKLIEENL